MPTKGMGAYDAMEARPQRGSGKKTLRSIEIERATNGGFIASHRFVNNGPGPYHEPEQHTFGESEGQKLMAHLKENLNIKGKGKDSGEEEE